MSSTEHADMTPCERAGVHLPGTGHSQADCPTLADDYHPA